MGAGVPASGARRPALLVAALLVIVASCWWLLSQQERELTVVVVNQGDASVVLALTGAGLREPLPALTLGAGEETTVTLQLADSGALRLSAVQPRGQVEAQLVADVAGLSEPQQLTIGPGHRYLLQARR